MSKWTMQLVAQCSNVSCPNDAQAGGMVVVGVLTIDGNGHRAITLLLCVPCATALAISLEPREQAAS